MIETRCLKDDVIFIKKKKKKKKKNQNSNFDNVGHYLL